MIWINSSILSIRRGQLEDHFSLLSSYYFTIELAVKVSCLIYLFLFFRRLKVKYICIRWNLLAVFWQTFELWNLRTIYLLKERTLVGLLEINKYPSSFLQDSENVPSYYRTRVEKLFCLAFGLKMMPHIEVFTLWMKGNSIAPFSPVLPPTSKCLLSKAQL